MKVKMDRKQKTIDPAEFWISIVDNRKSLLLIGALGTVANFSITKENTDLYFYSSIFTTIACIFNSFSSKMSLSANYILAAIFIILFAYIAVSSSFNIKHPINALAFLSAASLSSGIAAYVYAFTASKK